MPDTPAQVQIPNIDTSAMQRAVISNKEAHGFNTTDIALEFCFLYGEVGEAFDAYRKQDPGFASELADVGLYLLGIAEICGIDLGAEMMAKLAKNRSRVYEKNEIGAFVEADGNGDYGQCS